MTNTVIVIARCLIRPSPFFALLCSVRTPGLLQEARFYLARDPDPDEVRTKLFKLIVKEIYI